MNFSEKLTAQRRGKGMSQEQLAERLGVTRQSVSKWESGTAVPELSKLIALSALFDVSVDYLVKDWVEEDAAAAPQASVQESTVRIEQKLDALTRRYEIYRYTSRRKLFGLPLVDIRIGFGYNRHLCRENIAKGILAIGNISVGVISIGMLSAGIFSIGLLSLGLLALGCVAVGGGAFGPVAIGIVAVGAAALGIYAGGVAAVGQQIAVGVSAAGHTVVGDEIKGVQTLLWGNGLTQMEVEQFLLAQHPNLWTPILKILSFLGAHIY